MTPPKGIWCHITGTDLVRHCDGQIYVLDRRTGLPVTEVQQKPVPQNGQPGDRTSPVQPFSVGMPAIGTEPLREAQMWGATFLDQLWCRIEFKKKRYEGMFTPPTTQATIFWPGYYGGFNWGGVAVHEPDSYLILNDIRIAQVVQLLPREVVDGIVAGAPANRIDPRVTRAQLGFDLKSGDEIPYVPVRFNGGAEAYVLFDTGAERNVIDREFARTIGVERIWPGGDLHGAYRQSPGGYALVDSLGLGSISIERVPFAVGDFEALHLRGQGPYYIAAVINPALLLRDFVVVLDYGHRRIELVRYDAGGSEYLDRSYKLRRTVVPFRFDANGVWPILSVSLDGSRPLPFLADTGASDVCQSWQCRMNGTCATSM